MCELLVVYLRGKCLSQCREIRSVLPLLTCLQNNSTATWGLQLGGSQNLPGYYTDQSPQTETSFKYPADLWTQGSGLDPAPSLRDVFPNRRESWRNSRSVLRRRVPRTKSFHYRLFVRRTWWPAVYRREINNRPGWTLQVCRKTSKGELVSWEKHQIKCVAEDQNEREKRKEKW